ncbi:MAG: lamin tail domain-containing protein, partial [Bacteroidia bacterium]
MKRLIILLAIVGIFSSVSVYSQLYINEYSASNLNQFTDDYGKYEDWVELYNAGSTPVSLAGYYLSDDSTNVTKWPFPSGSIAAGGFARIWLSGRNSTSGTHYHSSFKLKQTKNNGEQLVLSDPAGTIIDNVHIMKTMLGHSRGRMFNGFAFWTIFSSPTINASNNTSTPYMG